MVYLISIINNDLTVVQQTSCKRSLFKKPAVNKYNICFHNDSPVHYYLLEGTCVISSQNTTSLFNEKGKLNTFNLPLKITCCMTCCTMSYNIVKQLYDTLSTPEEPRALYTVLSFTHSCTHDDGELPCSHSWPRGSWEKWGCHVISASL